MKTILSFKEFVGKTIKRIDETCTNMVKLEFTDGQVVEIYSECESGDFGLPFFMIQETKAGNNHDF